MTFSSWAVNESDGVVADINEILSRIVDDKKTVRDPEAVKLITNLQASLIAVRTRAGDMRKHWETANRNGEGRHHPHPKIDHKRAAAGDYDDPQELPLEP